MNKSFNIGDVVKDPEGKIAKIFTFPRTNEVVLSYDRTNSVVKKFFVSAISRATDEEKTEWNLQQ